MLGRSYEGQNCSAARALEIVGERWTLLIVRDLAFAGVRRFNELQRGLGVARNVLAARLNHLVAEGVVERAEEEDSAYLSYRLTAKGEGLLPVVVGLSHWGDQWYAPAGPPVTFHHAGCGGHLSHQLVCTECEAPVKGAGVVVQPGPGFGSHRQGSTVS